MGIFERKRTRRIFLALLAVMSLSLLFYFLSDGAGTGALQKSGSFTVAASASSAVQQEQPTASKPAVPVFVSGAVHRPDVYYLPVGSLVKDAVAGAGGFTAEADTSSLNLAAEIHSNQMIYVPKPGEKLQSATPQADPEAAVQVSLNTASEEELQTLPGIGLKTAQAIIKHRIAIGGYKSLEQLMEVPGIKEARFNQLKAQLKL